MMAYQKGDTSKVGGFSLDIEDEQILGGLVDVIFILLTDIELQATLVNVRKW